MLDFFVFFSEWQKTAQRQEWCNSCIPKPNLEWCSLLCQICRPAPTPRPPFAHVFLWHENSKRMIHMEFIWHIWSCNIITYDIIHTSFPPFQKKHRHFCEDTRVGTKLWEVKYSVTRPMIKPPTQPMVAQIKALWLKTSTYNLFPENYRGSTWNLMFFHWSMSRFYVSFWGCCMLEDLLAWKNLEPVMNRCSTWWRQCWFATSIYISMLNW